MKNRSVLLKEALGLSMCLLEFAILDQQLLLLGSQFLGLRLQVLVRSS